VDHDNGISLSEKRRRFLDRRARAGIRRDEAGANLILFSESECQLWGARKLTHQNQVRIYRSVSGVKRGAGGLERRGQETEGQKRFNLRKEAAPRNHLSRRELDSGVSGTYFKANLIDQSLGLLKCRNLKLLYHM
jgi:hypothetical protein